MESAAPARRLVVHVVDRDDAVRSGLTRLLCAAGLDGRGYGSTAEFLAGAVAESDACVLLDITAPCAGAPLDGRGIGLPLIAVSASDDVAARTRARALGARLFFRKPVDDRALLDAIAWVTAPVPGDTLGAPNRPEAS